MFIEDFDTNVPTSSTKLDSQRQEPHVSELFEKKELPCFDLQNLRSANKFSNNPDYKFFVELLEKVNKVPDPSLTEINWRKKAQTHSFIYSSLMAILFQPENVGNKSLSQLFGWYKRANKCKKSLVPELAMSPSNGKEQALIRKTFKSSLPASIQKMTRRIYLDRTSTIKPSFQSQRDSQEKEKHQAWERCQTRMYKGQQKRLKSNRQQGQLKEMREEAVVSRFMLLEKLANTNLLYSSSVLNNKPVLGVSVTKGEPTGKQNKDFIRSLKTVHVMRRYDALKVDRTRQSSFGNEEKVTSKLADIQGLTLMQSPFFKKKVIKIR